MQVCDVHQLRLGEHVLYIYSLMHFWSRKMYICCTLPLGLVYTRVRCGAEAGGTAGRANNTIATQPTTTGMHTHSWSDGVEM